MAMPNVQSVLNDSRANCGIGYRFLYDKANFPLFKKSYTTGFPATSPPLDVSLLAK